MKKIIFFSLIIFLFVDCNEKKDNIFKITLTHGYWKLLSEEQKKLYDSHALAILTCDKFKSNGYTTSHKFKIDGSINPVISNKDKWYYSDEDSIFKIGKNSNYSFKLIKIINDTISLKSINNKFFFDKIYLIKYKPQTVPIIVNDSIYYIKNKKAVTKEINMINI